VANIHAIGQAVHLSRNDAGVSWLPLYHDMGLVGGLLLPIYWNMPIVLMSPSAFLLKPSRWLRAIHDHRATFSPAPNFAYALCVRSVSAAEREGLDLWSWRVAFNGAEQINVGTLEAFQRVFGPCGMRPETMLPVYGLAECCLAATFTNVDEAPRWESVDRLELAAGRATPAEGDGAVRIASVGTPIPEHELLVVDEHGKPVPDRAVGHIVVRGPSIMRERERAVPKRLSSGSSIACADGRSDRGDVLGLRRRVHAQLQVSHRVRGVRHAVLHDRARRLPVHPRLWSDDEPPAHTRARAGGEDVALGRAMDGRGGGAGWTHQRGRRTSGFEAAVKAFVGRVLRAEVADCLTPRFGPRSWSSGDDAVLARQRARIAELPPSLHPVYTDCLELMVQALRYDDDEAQDDAELERSTDSIVASVAKAASAFFYIRQNASALATGGASSAQGWGGTGLGGDDGTCSALVETLRRRGASLPDPRAPDRVEVVAAGAMLPRDRPVIYAPLGTDGIAFLELAIAASETRASRPFVAYLERAGFRVGLSAGGDGMASDAMLGAYLRPLVELVRHGLEPARINAALRRFGFVRLPSELLRTLGPATVGRLVGADLRQAALSLADGQVCDPSDDAADGAIDALCLSLLAEARRTLRAGFVHPSIVDLAARELLDFPLQHRSLCSYLTRPRVREVLARRAFPAGIVGADVEGAEQFVRDESGFYMTGGGR
jgi:hypothetical protein